MKCGSAAYAKVRSEIIYLFGDNPFEHVSSGVSFFDLTPPLINISLSSNNRLCAISYRIMEVRSYVLTENSGENYLDQDFKRSVEGQNHGS